MNSPYGEFRNFGMLVNKEFGVTIFSRITALLGNWSINVDFSERIIQIIERKTGQTRELPVRQLVCVLSPYGHQNLVSFPSA